METLANKRNDTVLRIDSRRVDLGTQEEGSWKS